MANAQATQQLVDIESIRDGVIILKSGSLRAVLMCSSVNLALKSQDEQDALIYQYQSFLNGLDFPLEFVIHSRKLDIAPYINSIKELLVKQQHELLKIQTEEYIDFVESFVNMQNIMSKTFYAIIPFSPTTETQTGILGRIMTPPTKPFSKMSDEEFKKHKAQLWQRVESVMSGLRTFGVRSEALENAELMEMFFELYNPGEKGKEVLKQLG